jgi:hypothetical protein
MFARIVADSEAGGVKRLASLGAARLRQVAPKAGAAGPTDWTTKDVRLLLEDLLSLVPRLFQLHARCDEVDRLVHRERAGKFLACSTALTKSEDGLVVKSRFQANHKDLKRLAGTVRTSEASAKKSPKEPSVAEAGCVGGWRGHARARRAQRRIALSAAEAGKRGGWRGHERS